MALSTIYKNEVRRSKLFSSFTETHLQQIFVSAKMLYKRSGDPLFRKGEPATHFFIVRTGATKQFLCSSGGQEKALDISRPGDAVAEIQMFIEDSEYCCDCEMLEDGELFQFDSTTYRSILQQNSAYALPLITDLSRQINRQTEEIGNLALSSARHRLSHYLYSQLECTEKSDCEPTESGCPNQSHCTLKLPTSKSVIASLLSIQRETFSRTLKKLKEEEMIEVKGDEINILDLQGLRKSLA